MQTIGALFDTYDEVIAAVDALSDFGVASEDITIVGPRRNRFVKILQDAVLGAAIGGVAGVLAGLAGFAIPDLGLFARMGWLTTAIFGAAAGCIAGGVVGIFVNATGHMRYATSGGGSIPKGRTLVTARVHDDEVAKVIDILRRCGAINTNVKRGEYAGDGWDGFVSEDMWDEDIGSEDAPGKKDADQGR
ncbi:MAG: hypothetical protein KF810_09835 [Rhizobiaceae bacterium]|nr:hypothetical protein [Rhizobiaceae bacterium]